MSRHREALREMGDESLMGIVDLMTGEKDPRNLMMVFSILKVVMMEWDVTNHAEVRMPQPAIVTQQLIPLASFRLGVQLFPYHLPTSTKRSIWNHRTRFERQIAGLHLCIETLCSACYTFIAGQARLYVSEC